MKLYGALIGDIIGSTRELSNEKTEDIVLFPSESHFTDDAVMTIAVADKLLHNKVSIESSSKAYASWYKQYYRKYPNAGYGQMFARWAQSDGYKVQRSYGNGAAMRVTAIGYACKDLKDVWREVTDSCYYTHNNHEAKTGAKAVATAVFLANRQEAKEDIKRFIEKKFKYSFIELDELRDTYVFNSRTSYCVPPALEAFFESDSYESAVRKAISIGGDSDTIACMAGGIAEAYYGDIPKEILNRGKGIIDFGFQQVIEAFNNEF